MATVQRSTLTSTIAMFCRIRITSNTAMTALTLNLNLCITRSVSGLKSLYRLATGQHKRTTRC